MTIKVIGFVGAKVIFDAEMNTRALRSEWDQELDCELIKNSSKKRVLITGSSGAIGSAIARKFAHEGWPLLLQSRSTRALNEAVLVSANGTSLELIEADLSTKKGLDSLIERIELLGDIGAVVHTASPPLNSPLRDLAEINYSALKSIANAVLPQMLRQQYGKIMSIGSTAMLSLIDGFEDYAAAKSMAASYLKGLDAGFSAYGVNGYVFAPDFVATEYSKEIRGSAPSLLPAEVASKLYNALTSDSSFMGKMINLSTG
ncbi:MAG: SDR family NAD(P)-dependent oxidoreductase, partial [Rhodobacterales bacterium]